MVYEREYSVQLNIACSILEFFNGGLYVNKTDIKKEGNFFFIEKSKYPHFKATKQY